MVFFRSPEPGLPDGDAPRLLRMSPLHHSFRVPRPSVDRERVQRVERRERRPMITDDAADASSTASAAGQADDGKLAVKRPPKVVHVENTVFFCFPTCLVTLMASRVENSTSARNCTDHRYYRCFRFHSALHKRLFTSLHG